MAERDRFELDLGTALSAYAEDAPTQVRPTELARHFATAYPHRRTVIGRWRPVATPRLAWILLLLAVLLTAMAGGLLVVGSRPPQKLPLVVPPIGQLSTCPAGSTPDKPGPVDQARPPESFGGMRAFDRRAGRFVALVDILTGNEVTGVETWTFDVCTNGWTRMHPNREPSRSAGELVYDVDSDVTILVTSREVWAYDLRADTWTRKGSLPPIDPTSSIHVTSWAYDPVTGLVVAAAAEIAAAAEFEGSRPPELWSYDVATDTWTPIRQGGQAATGDRGVRFVYDASADRMVGFAATQSEDGSGYETWLFDLRTGTWSRAGADTPNIKSLWGFNAYPPAMVYDEVAERTVVFGEGGMAAYDTTEDRWEILIEGNAPEPIWSPPGPSYGWWMDAYDPVNKRLVGHRDADSIWAFDLATGQWTVLIEAVRPGGTTPADNGLGPVVPARPGWAPDLEAMLPSDVNGVTFTKTSVVGGIPSTRLGKGGWGTVPLGFDGLKPALDFYGSTLADLDIAIATPTDWLAADTFAIAFQVKGHDPTELARLLADLPGVGPAVTATVGGKQVQVLRSTGGMGVDLYVKDDVLFYVFTDGTPLIDGIIAALP